MLKTLPGKSGNYAACGPIRNVGVDAQRHIWWGEFRSPFPLPDVEIIQGIQVEHEGSLVRFSYRLTMDGPVIQLGDVHCDPSP